MEPNPGIFGRQVLEAYRDGFDSIVTRFGKEASSLMSRRVILLAILGLALNQDSHWICFPPSLSCLSPAE